MFAKQSNIAIALLLLLQSANLTAGERVALLPFADPNSTESARSLFEQQARKQLTRRGYEVVGADSVANVLRQLRIRNTAAPIEAEVRTLADSLDVMLVITGTIHRFSVDSNFSEALICARMIKIANLNVVWINCVSVSGGGDHAFFSKPAHRNRESLAKSATRKLFSTLKSHPKPPRFVVNGLVVKGQDRYESISCSNVAVIPPLDESEVPFSSEMFSDYVSSALTRRGFNVVDQGRVRNVMLMCEDLRHGQSVAVVSQALAESLGVDLVVTGTVSSLTSTHSISLGSSPEAAVELRMIDTRSNIVVWAEHLRRTGDARKGLFETGITHSPAVLALDMIADAIGDLRVIRRKNSAPLN